MIVLTWSQGSDFANLLTMALRAKQPQLLLVINANGVFISQTARDGSFLFDSFASKDDFRCFRADVLRDGYACVSIDPKNFAAIRKITNKKQARFLSLKCTEENDVGVIEFGSAESIPPHGVAELPSAITVPRGITPETIEYKVDFSHYRMPGTWQCIVKSKDLRSLLTQFDIDIKYSSLPGDITNTAKIIQQGRVHFFSQGASVRIYQSFAALPNVLQRTHIAPTKNMLLGVTQGPDQRTSVPMAYMDIVVPPQAPADVQVIIPDGLPICFNYELAHGYARYLLADADRKRAEEPVVDAMSENNDFDAMDSD